MGKHHSNPPLDTCKYEVEFPDGSLTMYTASMIAENLYAQVDTEGQQYQVMDEIIDQHTQSPLTMQIMNKYSNQHRCKPPMDRSY
jgi:hypothetical protein